MPSLVPALGAPVLITQHMPPMFTRLLANRLNDVCPLRVVEAENDMPVVSGSAYVAPGDFHMTVARKGTDVRIVLNQDPPEQSCRPAVDVMIRSALQVYGGHILGVILTGMGQDGLQGCELIRQAGGWVLAQDEASSVVWGMPGFVARAGLAHAVLPLAAIGKAICDAVNRPVYSAQSDPLVRTAG
jgi:two-component system chemotaxis response regulator CheB